MTNEHRKQMADLYHLWEKYENALENDRENYLGQMWEDIRELRKKYNGDRYVSMMAVALYCAAANYNKDEYTIVTIIKKEGEMTDEDCERKGTEKFRLLERSKGDRS